MDLQLQSLSPNCFLSGHPFVEGQRVASVLMRMADGTVIRRDFLEVEREKFQLEGPVVCRWVQVFKPRKLHENPERDLKLTAESLFMTLADPASEISEENTRLVQFMALMLERKRVLRPKGPTADGAGNMYEHAKSKVLYVVPAGELSPEFFIKVQEQLSVLVGGGAGG